MLISFPCDQSGPEGSHYSCYIGPYNAAVGDLFKGTKHRVVIEGSTLNYDLFSQALGIRDFYDLKQRVLYHGIGKTRGNIGHGGPLLLGLLYL